MRLVAMVAVAVAMSGCCQRNFDRVTPDDRRGQTGTTTPPGQIPVIPAEASAPPSVAEWQGGHPVNTVGANSAPRDCHMKIVREWLKVNCSGKIREVTNMEGFGAKGVDWFDHVVPGKVADLVVRVKKGRAIKARILREGGGASLFVNWPANNERPTIVALQIYNG